MGEPGVATRMGIHSVSNLDSWDHAATDKHCQLQWWGACLSGAAVGVDAGHIRSSTYDAGVHVDHEA